MSPLNATICTTISYTWVEWHYLKNKLFETLFFFPLLLLLPLLLFLSEACPDHNFFFFPDRSIIFGMWMHDHKAAFPVPKWPSWNYKGYYSRQYTTLWSCTHIPHIVDLSQNTKMLWPGQENTILKTIIWHWDQRSRSHKGHYGMWHTALWSYTHIPYIIDLSRKIKMLWPRQEVFKFKEHPPREPRGIEIGPSFSAKGYDPPPRKESTRCVATLIKNIKVIWRIAITWHPLSVRF
jgi:hypothetical protein